MMSLLAFIGPVYASLRRLLYHQMMEKDYPVSIILLEPEEVMQYSYYVAYGYVLGFMYNEDQDIHVIRLYAKGDIVSGWSFIKTRPVPSKFGLIACKNAELLQMDKATMQYAHKHCPGAEELSRKTLAYFEHYEIRRNSLLMLGRKKRVLKFYQENPRLLRLPSMITDERKASYLLIEKDRLRFLRTRLRREGLLPEKNSKS